MRRSTLFTVAAGVALGVTGPNLAEAAHRAVIPVPGGAACKTRPPVLLTAGRAPRTRLRLDLATMAGRSQSVSDNESVASRTLLADGSWRPTSSLDTAAAVLSTGKLAAGRLPVRAKLRLSGSSYPTRPSVTVTGYVDVLDGGVLGSQPVNDHFPREAVGTGATWRVVNCDDINQTPAKETRTYTLVSVSHGIARMSFRDVVAIDPAHLDVGSEKIGKQLVHFKLASLSGSATGTRSIPLERGIAESEHSVTRLQVTFHAVSASLPATLIHTTMVDTDSSLPSS